MDGLRKLASTYLDNFPILHNGKFVYLNSSDTGLAYQLLLHKYEAYVIEIMKEEISYGDVVCDVGAHVGVFSILMSSLVGDKGKVYSFEPDKENYTLLRKNIKINKLKNVFAVNKAVSNKKGKLTFYKHKYDSTDHRIFKGKGEEFHVKSSQVEVDKLDDLVKKDIDKVKLIKIDVQGVEENVIRGMTTILQNKDLKVILELWPYGQKQAGFDPVKLLKMLGKKGFRVFWINEEKQKLIKITKYNDIVKKAEDFHFYNLLCKR